MLNTGLKLKDLCNVSATYLRTTISRNINLIRYKKQCYYGGHIRLYRNEVLNESPKRILRVKILTNCTQQPGCIVYENGCNGPSFLRKFTNRAH